jgi:adenine/guanine/hypoxanthine permease
VNVPAGPSTLVSTPDLSLLGHFSLFGSFQAIGIAGSLLLVLP